MTATVNNFTGSSSLMSRILRRQDGDPAQHPSRNFNFRLSQREADLRRTNLNVAVAVVRAI